MEAAWAASQVPAVMSLYTECAVLCKDELIAMLESDVMWRPRWRAHGTHQEWRLFQRCVFPLGYSSSAELLVNRVARSGVRKNNGARRARLWPCAEGDGACSGSCRLGDARELRFSGRA